MLGPMLFSLTDKDTKISDHQCVPVGLKPLIESLSPQEGTQASSYSMVHPLGIFQEDFCVIPSLDVKNS